jgi:hypothetical protein
MPEEIDRQSILDQEHRKLLSLGYVVSAGFAALSSVLGLFYAGVASSLVPTRFVHSPHTLPNVSNALIDLRIR